MLKSPQNRFPDKIRNKNLIMSASRTLSLPGPSSTMRRREPARVPAEEQEPEERKNVSSGLNAKTSLVPYGTGPGTPCTTCATLPGLIGTIHRETAVIVHGEPEGQHSRSVCNPSSESSFVIVNGDPKDQHSTGIPGCSRSSGIVYRAMQMLEQWNYQPARISASPIPVDIIALQKTRVLLVQVIFSRVPVPDAKTLLHLYPEKVTSLRLMGTPAQFRKYIMVFSPKYGWKYYEVLAGGLIPAWHIADGTEK
jgi:hypothetical protein